MSSSAASMTAAPLSIVAIKISWPGQSTNDTCLTTLTEKIPSTKNKKSAHKVSTTAACTSSNISYPETTYPPFSLFVRVHVRVIASMRCVLAVQILSRFDAFIDLCVCIAQFDGDVAHQFILETDSLRNDKVQREYHSVPWACLSIVRLFEFRITH